MARAVKLLRFLKAAVALIFCLGAAAFFVLRAEAQRDLRTLTLVPFLDPWKDAKPRWLDIDDRRFHDFINKIGTPQQFTYRAGQVVFTYDYQQTDGIFRGHIEARGLKPNFAYQMKLCGKPRYGKRGWWQFGDDVSNENLGLQGRWWDDTEQQSGWDDYYRSLYVKAETKRRHSMVGYLFAGDFVTDEKGDASHDFAIEKPLHITWQDKQVTSWKDFEAGTFISGSTQPPYRGYGSAQEPRDVKLWYEHEYRRPARVNLPAGKYNCRLLITEESFHAKEPVGGHWQTVLATEDFQKGKPDADPKNDVVFEMANTPITAPLP